MYIDARDPEAVNPGRRVPDGQGIVLMYFCVAFLHDVNANRKCPPGPLCRAREVAEVDGARSTFAYIQFLKDCLWFTHTKPDARSNFAIVNRCGDASFRLGPGLVHALLQDFQLHAVANEAGQLRLIDAGSGQAERERFQQCS